MTTTSGFNHARAWKSLARRYRRLNRVLLAYLSRRQRHGDDMTTSSKRCGTCAHLEGAIHPSEFGRCDGSVVRANMSCSDYRPRKPEPAPAVEQLRADLAAARKEVERLRDEANMLIEGNFDRTAERDSARQALRAIACGGSRDRMIRIAESELAKLLAQLAPGAVVVADGEADAEALLEQQENPCTDTERFWAALARATIIAPSDTIRFDKTAGPVDLGQHFGDGSWAPDDNHSHFKPTKGGPCRYYGPWGGGPWQCLIDSSARCPCASADPGEPARDELVADRCPRCRCRAGYNHDCERCSKPPEEGARQTAGGDCGGVCRKGGAL